MGNAHRLKSVAFSNGVSLYVLRLNQPINQLTKRMSKIAFMFPGQGSQFPGMGKDFYVSSKKIQGIYREAESILNIDLIDKTFTANFEALKDTTISQLAILVNSFCCYQMVTEAKIFPQIMAGHSLGEYSALLCAGVISFRDTIRLVQKRSLWMAESSRNHPGKMAAVIGFPAEKVEEICREAESNGVISIANFNSPRQTVISGEDSAIDKCVKLARERGARRVVMLNVSGPFHTKLMEDVGEKIKGLLDSVPLISPEVPVVSNVNAELETDPVEIKKNLVKQVSRPVRWTGSVNNLINQGFDTFIEVGPKKVLSGLLSQFDKKVLSLNVEDVESLKKTRETLSDSSI